MIVLHGMAEHGTSPYINHFIQPDTIIPNPANPQSLNRYSYVLNNPIKLTDPTGHKCVGEEGECEDEDGKPINGVVTPKDIQRKLQRMTTSKKAKDFIKWWESGKEPPSDYPYPDMGGTCTIGYGHALPNDKEKCKGWPNQTYRNHPLSIQGAEAFLNSDIAKFEKIIKGSITVDLTQAQFDALVSYTFNTGDQTNQPYFVKGIPELINSGNFEAAAAAIAAGPKTSGDPPKESPRLVERRQAEADLFLYGTYGNYVPWSP